MSRSRRGLRAAAVAAGLLVALPAGAQNDDAQRRLRQLEVFENLLTETVQRYVNVQLNAGLEEERSATAATDGEPLVVKVGAAFGAHGMYIDGYGVIFSIQRPQVSVLPRAFAMHLQEPLAMARWRMGPDSADAQRIGTGVLRFQSAMIQRQLREMEQLLEDEIAAEADDDQIAPIRAKIEQLREQMADVESRFVSLSAETVVAADDEAGAAPEAVVAADGNTGAASAEAPGARPPDGDFFGVMMDRQRSMREVLERNLSRVRGAVNDAATDTFAHWGRVLTGLDDDDRLSVLVMPPTPWNLAQRHGVGVSPEEYVISVRYGDVHDFDDGKIDLDEFRRRARVHDRLGLEVSREPEAPQQER